jgi:hypothetical protein
MSKRIYRTSLGQEIDMDKLRLQNEEAIAIGNMKVNARGDELGPGGAVVGTKKKAMADYYNLNTPMVRDTATEVVVDSVKPSRVMDSSLAAIQQDSLPESISDAKAMRGSFASSVAGTATVDQEPMTPPNKAKGVQRI